MEDEKKYKEALERAKAIYQGNYKPDTAATIAETLQNVFPELAESEDEKIRKSLINYVYCHGDAGDFTKKEFIAWLEKQGEQKPVNDTDEDIVEAVKDTSILDMVEPKFKVGDWITNGRYNKLIVGVNSDWPFYMFKDGTSERIKDVDKKYHLWTIEDAKDGDVLVCEDYGYTSYLLLKSFSEKTIELHCWYNGQTNNLYNGTKVITREDARIHPATKEQRDLLFQKMKEAGYTFNFEKKELKKIITPIFNFGDTIIKKHNSDINKFGQFTITDISGGKYWYNDRIICDISEQYEWELVEQKPISFDTSTPVSYDDIPLGEKDYELHEATYFIPEGFHAEIEGDKVIIKRGEQKLAWSEEDEKIIKRIYSLLYSQCKIHGSEYEEIHNWLKLLKDRVQPNQWKPSKEQMETLEYYMVYLTDCKQKEILFGLYDQLAKL